MYKSKSKSNNPWTLAETIRCCEKNWNSKDSVILKRLNSEKKEDSETGQSKCTEYFKRLNRFTKIPRVLFFYDVVSIRFIYEGINRWAHYKLIHFLLDFVFHFPLAI